MNILLISAQSFPVTTGGLEIQVWNLAKAFKKMGHTPTILTGHPEKSGKDLHEDINLHYYNFTKKPYMLKLLSSYKNQKMELKKLSSEIDFDFVIVFHPLSSYAAKSILSEKTNLYVFSSPLHEELKIMIKSTNKFLKKLYLFPYYLFSIFLGKWAIEVTAQVAPISDFMKEKVLKLSRKVPTQTVYSGIDLEKFKMPSEDIDSIKEKLSLPKDKKIIFTARRLVPRMGIKMLLEAITAEKDNLKNTLTVIAGKGAYLEEYRELTKMYGVDDIVKLPGFISEEDLLKYYQVADLYIQPTISLEGFGLTVLEAMASGTPSLITPIGATKEIVSKFDTKLISKNIEPADFGGKIVETVNYISTIEDLPKKCRRFVEYNYSWKKMASGLIKLANL